MTSAIRAADFPFFPSVFLIGAPRCGTTSLSKLLGRHPEICFSRPKELNYFGQVSTDGLANIQHDYLDRYFQHYDPERHRVAAEGSVTYLYDPEALKQIKAIQPDARFLVAVRNPIDMLRSFHFRMLYLLEEDETNFETAWALQEVRAQGQRIPKRCSDPRRLCYREVASLGAQVERLVQTVGRDRCHIVVNDDVRSDPVVTCQDMLRFCGVNDDLQALAEIDATNPFPHRHKSRTYRWRWLQQILYKPPAIALRSAARSEVRRGVRPLSLKRLHKKLSRLNLVKGEAPRFSPEFKQRLVEEFDQDIAVLEGILDRDLNAWRQISSNTAKPVDPAQRDHSLGATR